MTSLLQFSPSRPASAANSKLRWCGRAGSLFATAAALSLGVSSDAQASLLVTRAEDSNAYVTSVSGTRVFTFDSLAPGTHTNVTWTDNGTTVGTIDQVVVSAANNWGGAGSSGSNYAVQMSNATNPVTNLRFPTPNAYFGLWWSAGDGNNMLTFFLGNTEIVRFTTQTLLNGLPNEYFGNPRNNQNTGEAYAFINFFGMQGTRWDRIEFRNVSRPQITGFESDNWTTRVEPWGSRPGDGPTPPGTPVTTVQVTAVVPEPSSALVAFVSLGMLCLRRRR